MQTFYFVLFLPLLINIVVLTFWELKVTLPVPSTWIHAFLLPEVLELLSPFYAAMSPAKCVTAWKTETSRDVQKVKHQIFFIFRILFLESWGGRDSRSKNEVYSLSVASSKTNEAWFLLQHGILMSSGCWFIVRYDWDFCSGAFISSLSLFVSLFSSSFCAENACILFH